jgi:predicted transcriptional regulator
MSDLPGQTARPAEGSRAAEILAEIEKRPGQTKDRLKEKLGMGSGTVERALGRLLSARLIGRVKDERGIVRHVPLKQWLEVDAPTAADIPTIAEAMARRAAARERHQQTTGETA